MVSRLAMSAHSARRPAAVVRASSWAVLLLFSALGRPAPAQPDPNAAYVSWAFTVQNDPDSPGYYSRAFTVWQDTEELVEPWSRAFTVWQHTDEPAEPWSRAFTAELSGIAPEPWSLAVTEMEISHSGLRDVRSSGECWAYPVSGTPAVQMAVLNAGPPPFDPNTWAPVHGWQDNHLTTSFACGQVPDPLAEPYVGALWFINFSDEVTLNNCESAFYRFTFTLPSGFYDEGLELAVNADDMAVAFLNGQPISAAMTLADLGVDRVDGQNLPVLTWPTMDSWTLTQPELLAAGENELVFAVMGDASTLEPTGLEFRATAWFDLRGDLNCDAAVSFDDINAFVLALSNPAGYPVAYPACNLMNGDCNADGAVDFDDINDFVALLSGS